MIVIRRSLFGIPENVERGEDLRQTARIRESVRAAVGMQVANTAPVGAGDLGWGGRGKDAEDLVQISVGSVHGNPNMSHSTTATANP